MRQIWVPDLRDPEVRNRVRRACQAITAAPARDEELAFVEAVQYWPEDED